MKKFQFHPEVNTINDNGLFMVGWAISDTPITYKIYDGKKRVYEDFGESDEFGGIDDTDEF